jgi:hypothetical protein
MNDGLVNEALEKILDPPTSGSTWFHDVCAS